MFICELISLKVYEIKIPSEIKNDKMSTNTFIIFQCLFSILLFDSDNVADHFLNIFHAKFINSICVFISEYMYNIW